ncbi:hypothetical protein [Acuticoccus mangrovi]|uniref:Uncharacterized protein n=1 Tax=Acuticoccus mangrovi TaxID=2796142 RepID=A0A934MDI5_9HYPH|nr:hypothetical protein [Acuticoccus mangrovi]MBJ3776397.1 hypothetical protein [Acuticoccus mangrovi]
MTVPTLRRTVARATAVYTNRGTSPGVRAGIAAAEAAGVPVEHPQFEEE